MNTGLATCVMRQAMNQKLLGCIHLVVSFIFCMDSSSWHVLQTSRAIRHAVPVLSCRYEMHLVARSSCNNKASSVEGQVLLGLDTF